MKSSKASSGFGANVGQPGRPEPLSGSNTVSQKYQAGQEPTTSSFTEASRQQWLDAIEKMANNDKIKSRNEYLERQVAALTLGNWQYRQAQHTD